MGHIKMDYTLIVNSLCDIGNAIANEYYMESEEYFTPDPFHHNIRQVTDTIYNSLVLLEYHGEKLINNAWNI